MASERGDKIKAASRFFSWGFGINSDARGCETCRREKDGKLSFELNKLEFFIGHIGVVVFKTFICMVL